MALSLTNLHIDKIKSDLGTSSNDVDVLCKHANINKWSRFKPYRYNKLFDLTEIEIKSINFGISPKTFFLNEVPHTKTLETPMFVWEQWQPPRGGSFQEYYRMGDFRSYNKNALSPLVGMEMKNSLGGVKPIAGNSKFPSYTPTYYGRLQFNPYVDIKLNEFIVDGVNTNNLYLTIVVGPNISGLNSGNVLYAQSKKTLGQAISQRDNELIVEVNTTNLINVMDSINKNIVIMYLAPYASTAANLFANNSMSLKLDNSVSTAVYNTSYAVYGDGNDGGNPPVSYAEGTWSWFDGDPFFVGNDLYFQMMSYTMSSTKTGNGDLYVSVAEFNGQEFRLTNGGQIAFNANGQQIIDISLINPFNFGRPLEDQFGNPLTKLTCIFSIKSNTPGILSLFNNVNLDIYI